MFIHGNPLGSTYSIVKFYITGVPSLPLQRFGLQSLAFPMPALVKIGHAVPVLRLSQLGPRLRTFNLAS